MACKKKKMLTKEEIDDLIETTLSGAIGGFSMPMGIAKNDPTMGGRNKLTKEQLAFALKRLGVTKAAVS